jgi:hypothetical protein
VTVNPNSAVPELFVTAATGVDFTGVLESPLDTWMALPNPPDNAARHATDSTDL